MSVAETVVQSETVQGFKSLLARLSRPRSLYGSPVSGPPYIPVTGFGATWTATNSSLHIEHRAVSLGDEAVLVSLHAAFSAWAVRQCLYLCTLLHQ